MFERSGDDVVAARLIFPSTILLLAISLGEVAYADDHPMSNKDPIIIAHRGASGYLPEHTLEAYALAIEQGADYIEPDLVATKDGYLIVRHEPNIMQTTNVKDRSEFRDRKRKAMIDGVEEEGYFVADFTLAEIKTLSAVQQFADRDQSLNAMFKIATFAEVIDLAQRKSRDKKRTIGIYPETKHPSYHQAIGLPLEDRLIAASGVAPEGSLEFNPPFDRPYDRAVAGDARYFRDLLTPQGLAEVATYADGIGLWKRYVISAAGANLTGLAAYNEANRKLLPPSRLIDDAHRAGLLVHAWTFRNEQHRLVADYQGNPLNEYLQFYRLGVDGVFSDFPDTAVAARVMHRLQHDPNYANHLTGTKVP